MRGKWFQNAAFGAFVHWGLFSIPGGIWNGKETEYIGEWLQARFRIPNREYEKLAAQFDPVKFDADDWIRQFHDVGMKYIVFTAKHHEGFSMFRTKASPFNIVDATPFARDPLAELAAACRKYGLKLGIYYSQFLDWHEPDGGTPAFESKNLGGVSWGNDWDFPDRSKKDFLSYFNAKVIPQITELLTNYGPVDVLWCDCPLDMPENCCRKLRELVHTLQPDCLINSRIGHGCQDYCSLGDNQMPGSAIPGLSESPMTLNDTWGWKLNDHNWKSSALVISQLLSLAEMKTNLLLNVGPKPDGTFPSETVRILSEIAEWFRKNGSVLYRSSGNPLAQELDYAYLLREGNKLHFFPKHEIGKVMVSGISGTVAASDIPYQWINEQLHLDFSQIHGLYPKVTLTFKNDFEIRKILMPQNGTLPLSAGAAVICNSEEPVTEKTDASEADADGRLVTVGSHIKLECGTLKSWQNPKDKVVWNVCFPEPAVYQVFCTTQSAVHSKPWVGGRRIEIKCGDSVLQADLHDGVSVGTDYYAAKESMLGEITIEEPGEHRIELHTLALLDPDAVQMDFHSLKFQIVQE